MVKLSQQELYEINKHLNQNINPGIIPTLAKKTEDSEALASLTRLLTEYQEMLVLLRKEFRGESDVVLGDGRVITLQTTKPVFIKVDPKTREPLRRPNNNIITNEGGIKLEYIPNEDAIEELITTLRMSGINKITPITNLEENDILMDLRSMLCKVAATLALKQVEWGLDKELMPLKQEQINILIKDARMVAKNGQLLQALRSTIQRVEQHIEGTRNLQKPLYS